MQGRRPSEGLLVWGVGTLAGLVVLGPGLASGALLNLDLAVVRGQPVPPGVRGLGPELDVAPVRDLVGDPAGPRRAGR